MSTPPENRDDSVLEKQDLEHVESRSVFEEDAIEAKKIVRKIDFRLMPMLMLLYTLTFLDRVNIGNARLWHLERDLGMSGYDYNIAVLVFYIPCILLEIPSNMVLSRVPPRFWVGFLTIGWGLSVTFAGFCTNMRGLVVARVFIGIFEAGMFPACFFLIGAWYRRHELVTRMAWFFVSNDIAGTCSGLLGAGLGSLDGTRGYSGWSWIFFVEGTITCLVGVAALFFLPPFPEQSTFLEPEQKAWLLRRLKNDNKNNHATKAEKMAIKDIVKAIGDWKILTAALLYLSVCITAYALSVFQPTVLKTFGWSDLKSNLLTAPVRVASGIVSVTVGIISDKVKRRGVFCLGGYAVSIMGLLLVMLLKEGNLRYMGFYFTAIGIYICQPLVLAWCVNQIVGHTKRGTLSAFAGSIGQLGGIISSVVFPSKDGPQYVPGMCTCIAFQVAGIIATINMWACCRWENKQRDQGKRDHLRQLSEEEQEALGEHHPDFRYTL